MQICCSLYICTLKTLLGELLIATINVTVEHVGVQVLNVVEHHWYLMKNTLESKMVQPDLLPLEFEVVGLNVSVQVLLRVKLLTALGA